MRPFTGRLKVRSAPSRAVRVAAAVLVLLLFWGGCIADERQYEAGMQPDPLPSAPLPKQLKEWSVITHANDSVALRVVVEIPDSTKCSPVFAAHHPFDFRADHELYVLVEKDHEHVLSWNSHLRPLLISDRVNAAGVNSRNATDPILSTAFKAASLSDAETFTSWVAWRDLDFDQGTYNFTLRVSRGLDGGKDQTLGGSGLIGASCDRAVTIREVLEDPHAAWLNSFNTNGSLDVELAWMVEVHEGAHRHATVAPTLIQISAGGTAEIRISVAGAIEKTFEWAPALPFGASSKWWATEIWYGPAGQYNVDWTVHGIETSFEIRILSLLPIASPDIVEESPFA